MEYLAKKSFSFLQDFAFTSINSEVHTNNNSEVHTSEVHTKKCNILQKSRFPFDEIAYLLVLIVKHILINGISCKKVVFLFPRFCIY